MPGFFDVMSGTSAKLKDKGDSVTGIVTKPYTERQATEYLTDKPKVNDSGQPVMMAVIELQTDQRDPSVDGDDGIRIVYAEKYGQRIAIGDAIRAAGASDLEVGGRLTVTCTGEAPSSKGSPLKTWSASYARPVGGLGNTGAATPPPTTAAVGDDLVAAARAAQEKQQREHAEMAARAAAKIPAQGQAATNGDTAQATADLLKIRELAKLGFEAPQIVAAMPQYTHDAIAAILAI